MTCDDVLNFVEAIAAGDLTPDERVAAHLKGCASCAASLEAARRLDELLRQRAVVAPSAQFTARTMARIRLARWRNEQLIDWGFNGALITAGLMVAAGVWLLLSRSGLTLLTSGALAMIGSGTRTVVDRVSPTLPLYALAAMMLATALAIWWWAEREAAT